MGSRAVVVTVVLMLTVGVLGPAVAAEDEVAATDVALSHLAERYPDADLSDVTVTDEYASAHNQVTHVYLRQRSDGLEVLGAEATVNVQDGVVVHSGSRFLSDLETNSSGQLELDVEAARQVAARAVDARIDAAGSTRLVYRALDDGTARLAWEVELDVPPHLWTLSIDAETGDVLRTADLVDSESLADAAARTVRSEHAHAVAPLLDSHEVLPPERVDDGSSYRVYAMPLESPNDGDRSVVENPADAVASPFGWHDTDGQPGPEFTITRGNNVNAYADTVEDNEADPNSQPDGGDELDFDHPILTFDATPAAYRDAAVTNLFYWNNLMHDVTHRYGFDEAAGNFQTTNYTGQGLGGDEVQAEAQDGGFVLNANFATPPDGQPGRMQMYLWVDAFQTLGLGFDDIVREYSHEVRDGDLDAGVIAHEYGHGVSNRLVGGPSNVDCLRTHDERQGEGWSDWWTYVMTMRPGDDGETPRGIGTYVIYQDDRTHDGIRITPYSTDMEVNPATYHTIRNAAEPHGVGYVWATMLWDLYWNLVEAHGFNPNVYEPWDTGGNNLAVQLVMDGMKFAVCEPGFVDARDAIIDADAALTGDLAEGIPGENECLIWRTFARRGLGLSATQRNPASKVDGREGYDVPEHCETG